MLSLEALRIEGCRIPCAAIAAFITYSAIFGATHIAGWAPVWRALTVPSMCRHRRPAADGDRRGSRRWISHRSRIDNPGDP